MASISEAGAQQPASQTLDPRTMVPVLDDPRLADVRVAWNAGDHVQASRAMAAAIAQHAPVGVERARWHYLLGRSRAQAKDLAAASAAFDEANRTAWALSDYAALEAAQAYANLGKHDLAAQRAAAVAGELPITTRARLVRADALDAMGSKEDAVQIWREHLAANPTGVRWTDGAVRIAQALMEGGFDTNRAVDALRLLRRVLSEAPSSKQASTAAEMEREILASMPDAEREKYDAWPAEVLLKRAEALEDAGRRPASLAEAEELLEDLEGAQLRGSVGCSATFLQARLLGLDRKRRTESARAYTTAADRCAGHKTELVKVLYAGAKMNAQVGFAPQARAMFERVEKEFAEHSYADDARLRGARVALLMRDEARFEKMLSTMAEDYPEGDMIEDGLFELALHRIDKGKWAEAVAPLEKSVRVRPREKQYWTGGRAAYFLARAYEQTGKTELAREMFERVVADYPLSYYMVLAHGRLRAKNPGAEAEAVKRAEAAAPVMEEPGALPAKLSGPGFQRAVELLALEQIEDARDEVRDLDLGTEDADALWIVARLYARAQATRIAHQVARSRSDDWSSVYPQGKWREAWQLAYPQMYKDIVDRETSASGIPVPLAYGIMREESAFDAGAVSWADAYGLMQLIMPTAQGVARSLKIKVDESALKKPEVNVKLGCKLLGNLRGMFPSAPVMAIPSYNAGAGATKRWLRNRSNDDFDLWVEHITYDETRGYTKRVLSTMAVYAYLYYPNELAEALQLPEQLDL